MCIKVLEYLLNTLQRYEKNLDHTNVRLFFFDIFSTKCFGNVEGNEYLCSPFRTLSSGRSKTIIIINKY